MVTAFISHNSIDKPTAREIGLYLAAENINVWFDEWKIPYGNSIPKEVNQGLDSCTHFILLWSENAAASPWVNQELNAILSKMLSEKPQKTQIIPILLDRTPLPIIISDRKYIVYNSGTESDRYEVVKAVTGRNPSLNYIEAIVRKYNEVIYSNDKGSAFGLSACPKCGKNGIEEKCLYDGYSDSDFYIANCKYCGWTDWTK